MLNFLSKLFANQTNDQKPRRKNGRKPARRNRLGASLTFENLECRRMMAVDVDANDQMAEAMYVGTLLAGTQYTRTGSVDSPTDVDMYEFKLPSVEPYGEHVAFDIDLPAGAKLDTYVRLFDANGKEIAKSDDNAGPGEAGGRESYLGFDFKKPGRYYLGVSAFPNTKYDPSRGTGDTASQAKTGSYTLRVERFGDKDDQMTEASFALGSILGLGREAKGSLLGGTDVNMYVFTVDKRKGIIIDLDRTDGRLWDSYLRVFDSKGKEIVSNDNGAGHGENATVKESWIRHVFEPGTYYIGVSTKGNSAYNAGSGEGDSYGSFGGEYTLNIIDVSAFSYAQGFGDYSAALGTAGGNISGSQISTFVFRADTSREYFFNVKIESGNLQTDVRVFTADGKAVSLNPQDLKRVTANGQTVKAGLKLDPGWYYACVTGKGNNTYDPQAATGYKAGSGTGKFWLTVS